MQVLLNLAGNAIDSMKTDGGGTLRLVAEDADADRVAFLVADDGPGIPPDVQERMYDPFFTTKGPGKGTGLGLHLVSEMVHAQGGTIRCDSRVGRGATFCVELPAVPAPSVGDGSDDGEHQGAADRGRRGDDPPGPGAHAAA
jgi:signal transduction histidine kinase